MARTLFPGNDETARAKVDHVYQQALERSPEDPVLARAASEHFRTTGRLKEAIEVLSKHAAAAPSSLDLRVRLGILMFAAKRDDEGEECLKAVLVVDPRQGLAHQSLAKFYRRQDDLEKARPHAVEALKIRGGEADEFLELAGELLKLERPREARLLLEKGIFDHPEDADIAVKLAIATQQDPGTRDQAAWRFREAESLSGVDGPATEPSFQLAFSDYLLESGQTEAAEARLRSAIKAYPPEAKTETATALRRLAGIWLDEGRNEAAARALLKRADGLDPP
jgi:predicted Zn-dependent protease